MHWARRAASRADWTAGNSRPMRMAMIVVTTKSSISVNPRRGDLPEKLSTAAPSSELESSTTGQFIELGHIPDFRRVVPATGDQQQAVGCVRERQATDEA